MAQASKSGSGPSGRHPLSPVIHGRIRLLILSFLLRSGRPASFTSLRDELDSSDGNLSVHLAKLEEAGLITIDKSFVGKRPRTEVKVTAAGRSQFKAYVKDLQRIVPGLS